jgi:hypothetical protein
MMLFGNRRCGDYRVERGGIMGRGDNSGRGAAGSGNGVGGGGFEDGRGLRWHWIC